MKVRGLDSLVSKLRKLPDDIQMDVKADIRDAADSIVMDAGDATPVDLGYLKNSITSSPRRGGLDYVVRVGAKYAPYIEFGTGTEVEIPNELTEYASQFKGAGKITINLPARPFFFPAYFKHRAELIKTLKQTLIDNFR